MRRLLTVVAVLALTAAACGDDTDNTEATSPPTTAATTTTLDSGREDAPTTTAAAAPESSVADVVITEVVFGEHVTVTNTGDGDVDISGLWLCNRPSYTPLDVVTLGPGESVQVDASALGALPPDGGEAALYISNSFGDSSAIIDYVAWGSGGGRGSVAEDAGIWPAGDSVVVSGASISAPKGGSSSADWS